MIEKNPKSNLRKKLTQKQYEVTQHNATEGPFTGKYWNHFETGLYVDVVDGTPLFASTDKFPSSCGWPSFSKPIAESSINQYSDRSHNMLRTEVRSARANSHLGHVFEDGPCELGGLRYCINSAALRFIPADKLAEEGYGDYLALFSE